MNYNLLRHAHAHTSLNTSINKYGLNINLAIHSVC